MRKILILEDSDERIVKMRHGLFHDDVYFAKTAEDCIKLLEASTWDIVSLDHDLGGQEMVESGPGTGYEVAKWLEQHPQKKPDHIILHSYNPVGVANMKVILPEADIQAGWWIDKRKI